MNTRMTIFGLIIGWTLIAAADDRKLILEERVNGATNIWFITNEKLAQIPEWDYTTPPPFPIEKAIAQTIECIKSSNPDLKKWELESITVNKIWDYHLTNRWYYKISSSGSIDVDGVAKSTPFSSIVLMDGTFAASERKE